MKIALIGAGVAGLAIGWRLVQAGAEVTILERSQPGSGATGAAAGMLAVTAELADAHAAEIDYARYSIWAVAGVCNVTRGRIQPCIWVMVAQRRLVLAEDAAALASDWNAVSRALSDCSTGRSFAPWLRS